MVTVLEFLLMKFIRKLTKMDRNKTKLILSIITVAIIVFSVASYKVLSNFKEVTFNKIEDIIEQQKRWVDGVIQLSDTIAIKTSKQRDSLIKIELQLLNDYLNAWKLICEGNIAGGKIGEFEISDRFRWLAACRSTIIQSSKTHPGICKNPEAELHDNFEKYVL